MTSSVPDEVQAAEQTLTVIEALAQGWFVADFFRGEELIRRYGRTAEEAHARLLSEFEAGVTVQAPRGGVVTAPPEQPTRETCIRCGTVANLDPSEHTERYGHKPVVVRDGQRLEFDFRTYAFTKAVAS